jgi:hypothetical protein
VSCSVSCFLAHGQERSKQSPEGARSTSDASCIFVDRSGCVEVLKEGRR